MVAFPRLFRSAIEIADWIEVELLAGRADTIAMEEVIDDFKDEPPDDVDAAENFEEGGLAGAAREKAENLVAFAFAELASRAVWLGDRYRLTVAAEVASLSDGGPSVAIGRFLAMARARQLIGQQLIVGEPKDPGYLFEELVTLAVQSYATGTAVRFGNGGPGNARGHGLPLPLADAIDELKARMNERGGGALEGQSDYRADAIAWRPFGDRRSGQLVMACQATISERDWFSKQLPHKWESRKIIGLMAAPVPAVAFVETLSLYPEDAVYGALYSIPLDRMRILSLVSDTDAPASVLDAMNEWADWVAARLPK